jgi:hypothetical protein
MKGCESGTSVNIVSGYGLDDRGSIPGTCSLCPDLLWGPPSFLSPGGKARPGRNADYSPASGSEVENE